jgi:excisionase family DNA binding protein
MNGRHTEMSTLTTGPGTPGPNNIGPLLTVKDVASLLAVHENYVYDLASRGELPSYKIGGMRRFRLSEVYDWLDRQSSRSYNPSGN